MSIVGKVCLITGSSSGHGRAVARELARQGAEVILHGPREGDCDEARNEIEALTGRRPRTLACDFASRRDIERGGKELLSWRLPLQVVVNNAGLVSRFRTASADGIEMTFAVNYLAMFQFTLLLLPRILEYPPARIVNVDSDAHMIATIDPNDITGETKRYSMAKAYGRSKLAVGFFTVNLSRRLEGTNVTVNAVDPGPMATNIAKKPGVIPRIADALIQLTFPPPATAARTAIHLAASPELEGVSGRYFRSMRPKQPRLRGGDRIEEILWNESARLTGVDFRP